MYIGSHVFICIPFRVETEDTGEDSEVVWNIYLNFIPCQIVVFLLSGESS
jgi:uncharacterized membrane protein